MTFTVNIRTSKLTKIVHYNDYQQKLYDEVKRLKKIEVQGFRKISYILYEKGYRFVRTNSILRHNYVYSIYKKVRVREKRMRRDLKNHLQNVNENLGGVMNQIQIMSENVISSIGELSMITEESSKLISDGLESVNSSIQAINLINSVQTY